MIYFRKIILYLILTLALFGCTQTQFKPEDIRLLYSNNNILSVNNTIHIDGLKNAINRENKVGPVRVLTIHGMISKNPDYSKKLRDNLAEALQLTCIQAIKNDKDYIEIERGYDFEIKFGNKLFTSKGTDLEKSQLRKFICKYPQSNTIQLVFYELLWSPFRDMVKDRFFACFEIGGIGDNCPPIDESMQNNDRSYVINKFFKNRFMIQGMSDAIIVLSPFGDILRDDISLAMCFIAKDMFLDGEKSAENIQENKRCDLNTLLDTNKKIIAAEKLINGNSFFVITSSLGSFLFMDVEYHYPKIFDSFFEYQKTIEHNHLKNELLNQYFLSSLISGATVFMNANQVAMLMMDRFLVGNCKAESGSMTCPNTFLRNSYFNSLSVNLKLDKIKTNYIAFNNKNDVLGYELPPYLAASKVFGTLINVSVRNYSISFWDLIPGVSDPVVAHLGHDSNPAVLKVIVEGIRLENK